MMAMARRWEYDVNASILQMFICLLLITHAH